MAGETLLTFDEMLAALPDNSSQLISPLDMRDIVIALSNDIGFVSEENPFTIPIVSGVPVSILGQMPTPVLVTNRWVLDGNNQLTPDWAGVTINPGTSRLLRVQCQMAVDKVGAGDDVYEFNITVGGVIAGRTITLTLGALPVFVSLNLDIVYDQSVAAPIDVVVTGIGTIDNLDVTDLSLMLIGAAI